MTVLIASFEAPNKVSREVIEYAFGEFGMEYTLLTLTLDNLSMVQQQIAAHTWDKVLLLGKETNKIFFPSMKRMRDSRLVQTWHPEYKLPFYFADHPNKIVKTPDIFVEFMDDLEFCCQTPCTELTVPAAPDYHVINSPAMLELMVKDIYALKPNYLVCDIETTGLNFKEDKLRAIGIAASEQRVYIIPALVLNNRRAVAALKQVMEDESLNWCGQNFNQFDRPFLRSQYGIDCACKCDSLLAAYALDPSQSNYSLDTLSAKWLRVNSWKNLVDDYATVAESILYRYLALDLVYSFKLVNTLNTEMQTEGTPEVVHDTLLIPASDQLGRMTERGIRLDVNYLVNLNTRHEDMIEKLQKELWDSVGFELNIRSPKQVSEYLYNTLKLPKMKSVKSSETCTGEADLLKLHHPVVDKILQLKRYKQINKNFVKGLLERVWVDGCIHPSFNLHITDTGRLSSSNPNGQQWPSDHHDWFCDDFNIKNALVARPGYTFIEVDESQVELRVLAWFTQDPFLINAYRNDEDLHRKVGAMVYGIDEDLVSDVQRSNSKKFSFGSVYGVSPMGLAEQLVWETHERDALQGMAYAFYNTYACPDRNELAKDFDKVIKKRSSILVTNDGEVKPITNYVYTEFEQADMYKQLLCHMYLETFLYKLEGYGKWAHEITQFALENGYVETPFGRRRYFPYITKATRSRICRQAVNTPIQSTASDICLTSIIDSRRFPEEECRPVLTVHDSILFETREDKVDEYLPQIYELMSNKSMYLEDRVPFKSDAKIGNRYGSMKKVG